MKAKLALVISSEDQYWVAQSNPEYQVAETVAFIPSGDNPCRMFMAERVGFEKALSDRLFAFNMMPKTDVFTVTYLLSHLEHESQKKR